MMTNLKSRELTTKLNFEMGGVATGDHLLVLHGWGMNASVWQGVTADLEQHFQVMWLDLPGHGVNYNVQANDLTAIVAMILPLLKQRTHLMGWSLGGLIAQEMVRQRPDLIKRVIMVATTPRFSQTESWNNAMPNALLAAFADGLANDLQGTLKRFIALQFIGVKNSQVIQRQLRVAILANQPNQIALQVGLEILQQQDFINLKMVQQQLWILGEKDRLVPVEVKMELANLYPDAVIEVIKKAGHAPFMTHPKFFIERVLHFLKGTTNA
jgi:pimeloyl-[acyl-carrier protein] methyl ester esterase